MDVREVNEKLHYVIELLGDLWHYLQAGAHACSCSVCTKKQSLARSIITKALQEVVVIANCFDSNTNCETTNNHPNLNNSRNCSHGTLPPEQDVGNTTLRDDVYRPVQQNTNVEKNNSSSSTLRNNNRDERKSSSVSSDSLRDSGLNTSLSSQSVSPIVSGRCQHRSSDNTQLQVSDLLNATSSCDVVNVTQSPHDTSRADTFSSSNRRNRPVSGSQCVSSVQANRSSHLPTRRMFVVQDDCPDTPNRQILPIDSQLSTTSNFPLGSQARSSFASQGLMFLSFPLVSPPALMHTLEGYCRHSEQFLSNPDASCENTAINMNQPCVHQAHVTQIGPVTSIHSSASAPAHNPLTSSQKDTSQLESTNVTNTVLDKSGYSFHQDLTMQEAQLQRPVKHKTEFPLQDRHLDSPKRSHVDEGCVLDMDKPSSQCFKESHAEQFCRKLQAGSHEQSKLHSSSTESKSCSLSAVTQQQQQLCLSSSTCDKKNDLVDSCNHHHHHQIIPDAAGNDGWGCCKCSVCDSELCENTSHLNDSRFMWRPWKAKDMIMGLINTESDDEKHVPDGTANVATSEHSDAHFLSATDANSDAHFLSATDANSDPHFLSATDANSDKHFVNATDANSDKHFLSATDANSDKHFLSATDANSDKHFLSATDANSDKHFLSATDANSDKHFLSATAAVSDTAHMDVSMEDSAHAKTVDNGFDTALVQDGVEQPDEVSSLDQRRAGYTCQTLDKVNSRRKVSEIAPSSVCLSADNISLPHNVHLEQHNQNNVKVVAVGSAGAADMCVHSKESLDDVDIRTVHEHKSVDADTHTDTVKKCKESPASMERSLKCLSNIVQSPKSNKSYIYSSPTISPEVFGSRLSLDKENSNVCLQKPDFKSASRKLSRNDTNTDKSVRHKQVASLHDTLPTGTPVNPGELSDLIVHRCTSSAPDTPVSHVHVSRPQCNTVTQAMDTPVSHVHFTPPECNTVTQAVDTPVSHVRVSQPQCNTVTQAVSMPVSHHACFTQSDCNTVTQAVDKNGKLSLAINHNLTSIDHSSRPTTSNNKIPWGAPAVMVESQTHTEHEKNIHPLVKFPPKNPAEKCKPDSNRSVPRHCGSKQDVSDKHCTWEVTTTSPDPGNHVTFKRDARGGITTNGSLKATWKDTQVMKTGRINLNQTLPACKTPETKNTSVHQIINESYEANQSFPKVTKSHQSVSIVTGDQTAAAVCSHGVDAGMHQLSSERPSKPAPRNRRSIFGFSPPDPHSSPEFLKPDVRVKGQVAATHQDRKSTSAEESGVRDFWSILDVSGHIGQIPSIQEVLFNCVTSSLCIVDAERNGKILSLNESFQHLIGVHEKVVGQKLFRFVKFRDFVSNSLGQSLPQSFVLADGHITDVTGKLAHCVNANGDAIPVSVWTVPLKSQPKLTVCVIEVSVLIQMDIYLNSHGQVLMYSQPFEDILGSTPEGDKVTYHIPEVDYSQSGKPQHISLEAKDGCYVPVMVTLGNDPSVDTEMHRNNSRSEIYPAVLSVSMNLSGLMVVGPDGVVTFCDKNYFRINLGHSHLEGKHQVSDFLSGIIKVGPSSSASSPDSSPALDCKSNSTSSNMALAEVSCLQSGDTASIKDRNIPATELYLPQSCFSSQGLVDLDDSVTGESDDEDRCNTSVMEEPREHDCLPLPASTLPYQTSTPCKGRDLPKHGEQKDILMERGTYLASFLHGNGSGIPVTFKLSHIETSSGTLFCLWMCIMPGGSKQCADSDHSTSDGESEDDDDESEAASTFDEEELGNHLRNLNLNKQEDTSFSQMMMDQAGLNQSHNAASDADLLDLEVAVSGSFGNKYAVCEALGQGSFGFVRRAKVLGSTGTVVVKFIKKSSMFEDSWISHESSGKKVPLEVSILRETYNEHIIKLLDFHENQSFVQMVMEDFGETDLFDFIDQVEIDEPLACYLFRQILWAVDYLHSKKIIHRDIKDENVIVSRSFHCKLIDFGSATYMLPEGEMFTKFRGTLEYCSPEVHNGAKYRGPELDVWALGVTLYTIIFRENPFTASEVPGSLNDLPHPITADALTLLLGLLQPDPLKRFTVLRALSCDWLRQIVDLSDYSWCEMFGDVPAQSESMLDY